MWVMPDPQLGLANRDGWRRWAERRWPARSRPAVGQLCFLLSSPSFSSFSFLSSFRMDVGLMLQDVEVFLYFFPFS
jgi:hypothetical protein